jgi:hypothetical protein
VDVEFSVPPKPETPFGCVIANSMKDEYFSSKDLCSVLQISPSVLGKIVGAVLLDNKLDLGLNLKRNGSYHLMGYSRRVEYNKPSSELSPRSIWREGDTIRIIGSEQVDITEAVAEQENVGWEYSALTANLIHEFRARFPMLFQQLELIPHQKVYTCEQLFGNNGRSISTEVFNWLKAQPFFKLPRTPFTTHSLSR